MRNGRYSQSCGQLVTKLTPPRVVLPATATKVARRNTVASVDRIRGKASIQTPDRIEMGREAALEMG
jgi:hypothetical protein